VGITGYFDQIIASAYVGHEKPHPAIFNQALKAMGVAPEQAIHIGDDYEADVHGAQGVGMEGVLVWRSTTPPPNTHHPVIADLTGLYDLLLAAI
jgi:putative hydrolase of the HAD superfamily